MDIWFGVWAPNGISPDVIARVNRELARTLVQPAIKQRFADLGAEPAPMDSVAFRKLLDDEGKVLTALIRDRKVAVD